MGMRLTHGRLKPYWACVLGANQEKEACKACMACVRIGHIGQGFELITLKLYHYYLCIAKLIRLADFWISNFDDTDKFPQALFY